MRTPGCAEQDRPRHGGPQECGSRIRAARRQSTTGGRCASVAMMATNFERAFAERPDVYAAWVQLNSAIKAGMDLRRYELATLASARRLRSSYCCLAHGSVLR